MIETIIAALGLMLIIEGLVYALAPSFVEKLLETLKDLSEGQRRQIGLLVVALGVVVCSLAALIAQ